MQHLDDALNQLIQTTPDAVPSEVWTHVRHLGCPTCDAYRAGMDPAHLRRLDQLLGEPEANGIGPFTLIPKRPGVPPPPASLWITLGLVALGVVGFIGFLIAETVSGPGTRVAQAPQPEITVRLAGPEASGAVERPGAKVSSHQALVATVALPEAAKVSLVHIDEGHGMEAMILNVPLGSGEHVLLKDGKPLSLKLDGLDGPQKLVAVVCDRDVTQDEALSAGKGLIPEGVSVAPFPFTVLP